MSLSKIFDVNQMQEIVSSLTEYLIELAKGLEVDNESLEKCHEHFKENSKYKALNEDQKSYFNLQMNMIVLPFLEHDKEKRSKIIQSTSDYMKKYRERVGQLKKEER